MVHKILSPPVTFETSIPSGAYAVGEREHHLALPEVLSLCVLGEDRASTSEAKSPLRKGKTFARNVYSTVESAFVLTH